MPKISVIIPSYNCDKYVAAAIDSVLAQTYKDIEVVVVDDGSADDTKEVLKRYGQNIKCIYQEHSGVSRARNSGIANATGMYLSFLDADDLWLPEKLEKQIGFLEKHSQTGLVVCDLRNFDERGEAGESYFEHIGFNPDRDVFENGLALVLEKNFCLLDNTLIKKECINQAGMFDEKLFFAEDMDLFARLAAYYKIGVMPEVLVRRRLYHAKTRSSSMDMDERKDSIIYILDKIEKIFPALISKEKIPISKLKAKNYFDHGYMRFTTGDFMAARLDFKSALRYKRSLKAYIYYTATFFNKRVVLWLKKIKNRLISLS